MRRAILIAAAMAALTLSAPAWAAPTCQTLAGDTVRCDAPGAMPVGWTPSPEQLAARPAPDPPDIDSLVSLALVLGGLFALIALIPRFDGRRDADWGGAEDED